MPFERNGKHWCAPDQEEPDAAGEWACSCGQLWLFTTEVGFRLWETPEDHDQRKLFELEQLARAEETE